jgi:16S rRNA (cytidine1402-2'-O)-methyltransferase
MCSAQGVVMPILDFTSAQGYLEGVTGTLFVVPTMIGDLGDLSPRARLVLGSVDIVAAEDTRVARQLFRNLGQQAPKLVSYHDHNETKRTEQLVEALRNGQRVALISDAGTPLVSDPGYRVLNAAIAAGIDIVVLPGPCAAIAVLSGSGLPTESFLFLGFLPRDPGPKRAILHARRHDRATILLYEAPHRLLDTLAALRESWGDRRVALAHNLTKPTEVWRRGIISAVEAELQALEEVRGEITLAVEGFHGSPELEDSERVGLLIARLVQAGVPVGTVRDVVAEVYDRPRREVYQQALEARERAAEDE